jgi:UDP-N-acetylmuramoylalanine--D-glutamate ligase
MAGTLERAVELAYDAARRDDADDAVILLAPACASFDQFTSFEARGDAFRNLVRNLETRLEA